MANPYTWWTLTEAIAALRGRLQAGLQWTDAELTLYLQDSLRVWNALTEWWKVTYALNNPSTLWQDTGTLAGNPRLRTLTDADLYTRMQYMLLEPPTGAGTWTGSSQFDLASMQYALSKRRNEVIQMATCNIALTSGVALTPNTRTAILADTVLEPMRTRFMPVTGDPIWLSREDLKSFEWWEPNYLQTTDTPNAWDVISETPLTIGLDNAPNVPGTLEVLTLNSGPEFAPPAATLLGIPDDWAWVAMYGALGDLLDSQPERMDPQRAQYCRQRYEQGLKLISIANWMVDADTTNAPTDTLSLAKADWYSPGWDQTPDIAWPQVVVAGMDFFALPGAPSVQLTLVGNQPVPSVGTDYLQVSRDVADAILDYAQHEASFKIGADTLMATMPLYQGFFQAAAETNKRIAHLGLNFEEQAEEGRQEQLDVPRS